MKYTIENSGPQDPLGREGTRYDFIFSSKDDAISFIKAQGWYDAQWFWDNYSVVEV